MSDAGGNVDVEGLGRSYLFVPASRPERFDKALASDADFVVIDLEDAVPAEDKAAARGNVADWWRGGERIVVRINAVDTPWFEDDLAMCCSTGALDVMLPKAHDALHVRSLIGAGIQRVWPLIESCMGFSALNSLALERGVHAFAFGSVDFQLDAGLRGATEDDLLPLRAQLIVASRCAGLRPPVDGVTMSVDDAERVRQDAARARRLGFSGKLCIHPKQVAVVNDAFTPSVEEVAWARRVIEAADNAAGHAIALDGKMIDLPVIRHARRLLRETRSR